MELTEEYFTVPLPVTNGDLLSKVEVNKFSVPHCRKTLVILQIISPFIWKFPSHAESNHSFKCHYHCTCAQCLVPVINSRLTFLLLLLYHLGKKFPWIHHYRGISLCDLGTQFLVCHQDNVFLWKRRCKKSVYYNILSCCVTQI